MEALGGHVQQEAPDELVLVKPQRLPAVGAVEAIVLASSELQLGSEIVCLPPKSLPKSCVAHPSQPFVVVQAGEMIE